MVKSSAFLGYGVELTNAEELELIKKYELEKSGSGDVMWILNELLGSNTFGWLLIDRKEGGCIFYLTELSTLADLSPIQVTFDISESNQNAIAFFQQQTQIMKPWEWHLMLHQS